MIAAVYTQTKKFDAAVLIAQKRVEPDAQQGPKKLGSELKNEVKVV